MEKKTRDYLTIAMAMLTILLCGYGIGYLVGEKKGLRQSQDRILLKLYEELNGDLDPDQRAELKKLRRELSVGN